MSSDRPILIVDDDRDLRLMLAEQLALDGEFTAVGAGTLAEAEHQLAARMHGSTPSSSMSACRTATGATSASGCAGRATRCRSSC